MKDKVLFPVDKLVDFSNGLLVKVGLTPDESAIVTDTMILGDLRGVKSHGIVRLETYLQRIECAVMDPRARMSWERNSGAIALLDAGNGFGQLAGTMAMKEAMRMAGLYGIGMVAVRNSNHFGIASYYSMMAMDKGMIGAVMTNASPAMAPFGTITPLFGTNPLSVAIPAGSEKSIVLDMSMSLVARGKIRYAELTGQKIPEGWALDEHGNPTTDPIKALKGSLVPIGGAKGSGLSLVVDILCGLLTHSSRTGEVKNITDVSGPALTGHVFVAINISHFLPLAEFKNSLDQTIQQIKKLQPKNAGDRVYMAGEIEHELLEKQQREGISLDGDVVQALNALAERYNSPKLSQ
jgi:LDH2 family malate/lactate/ureidoglycolate dehydrogenase